MNCLNAFLWKSFAVYSLNITPILFKYHSNYFVWTAFLLCALLLHKHVTSISVSYELSFYHFKFHNMKHCSAEHSWLFTLLLVRRHGSTKFLKICRETPICCANTADNRNSPLKNKTNINKCHHSWIVRPSLCAIVFSDWITEAVEFDSPQT